MGVDVQAMGAISCLLHADSEVPIPVFEDRLGVVE